jgi:hypothetical protein
MARKRINAGKPLPFQPEPADLIRFLSRIELADPPDDADVDGKCWIWTGHCDEQGYGQIKVKGRAVWVHRFAQEAFRGPLSHGLEVDHKCRVRNCCNPAHAGQETPTFNRTNTRRRRREPAPF